MTDPPLKIDLKKNRGMAVLWADGRRSYYSIAYLRRMSPSAEAREQRKELERNPLAVIQPGRGRGVVEGPLEAESAEMVGNYAIRINFSDGHRTGLFSWAYLREIDRGEEVPPSFELEEDGGPDNSSGGG